MRPARSRAALTTSRSRCRRCSTRQQRRGRDGGTMGSRIVSRRDLEFQLFEVLDVESLRERPRFAQHNRKADEHEPTFHDGRVHLIPEVKEALAAYIAAGFLAAGEDYEKGGMQLPTTVRGACQAIFAAANVSTTA